MLLQRAAQKEPALGQAVEHEILPEHNKDANLRKALLKVVFVF